MTTFWQYAVFGLGASAIYTLLALGLIVIYSGSGVLNFAQAAMATLGAYLYFEMRYIHGWGFWPAFLFGVAVITLLGVLIYHLVMRPLRDASALAKTIASLGILILIQGVIALKWHENPRNVNAIFPTTIHQIGNVLIPGDRIYLVAIAVLATALLWVGVEGHSDRPRDPRQRREPARRRDARLVAARARDDLLGARCRARRRGGDPDRARHRDQPRGDAVLHPAGARGGPRRRVHVVLDHPRRLVRDRDHAVGVHRLRVRHRLHLGPQADAAVLDHHRAARACAAKGFRSAGQVVEKMSALGTGKVRWGCSPPSWPPSSRDSCSGSISRCRRH